MQQTAQSLHHDFDLKVAVLDRASTNFKYSLTQTLF